LAREVGNRVVEATAVNVLGTIHRATGELSAALARHREALELARRSGNAHVVAEVCLDTADVCRALGQLDLAASHAAQALTISRANDYQRLAQRASALAGAST
jgi:ATP/maltotriose-dependent transcriptional regulator MalT